MKNHNPVFRETAYIALGEGLCLAVMLGLFALAKAWSPAVLWGGVLGTVLAVANFFFLAVGTSLAADKAEKQDVKGGQTTVRLSFLLRYLVLIAVILIAAKSGFFHPLALILPLALVRPILAVAEFFRKASERNA